MKRVIKPWRLLLFAGLCLLLLGSAYFTFNTAVRGDGIKRGLDIAGGLYVLLEAVETGDQEVDADAIQRAITVIRSRVDELGVAEPVITAQGKNRIRVELPDIQNVESARKIIGQTARLSFVDPLGNEIVTGAHLVRANMQFNTQVHKNPYVSIEFNREGAELFREATAAWLDQPIAILLDGKEISRPVVNDIIADGRGIITGNFTFDEAAELALLLRSGSLPLELREMESKLIGPTLGRSTEKISVWAAGVGLAAVLLFMLLFYRLAGLIAGVSLVFYLTLVLGALVVLPTTLTLPGIAGLILSIGMAVDANVIIFERIKDELRAGRTVRTATEAGFQRAFRAILDSNVTTIIATVVLFALASGPVRGFAVTLFIGILCSMFTAIVLTRFLLRLAFQAGVLRGGAFGGVKS
jgi:protein-export SecD/SecF family membrane protein